MSHDPSRHDRRGNNQNYKTPLTNGVAPNNVISKSRSAQFMDGTAQFQTRTAYIDQMRFDNASPQRPASVIYSDSTPRKMHHHNHSDADDITDDDTHVYGHTTSVIGPSASIPELLGSARKSRMELYTEGVDGAGMSRQYDVTVDESDRRKKAAPQQQRNVELLTYKPISDKTSEGMGVGELDEGEKGETDMSLSQQDFVTDLDVKIKAMIHTRKTSVSSARAPKTTAPPTKEGMREVMNMAPEERKKKSSSHAEGKRHTRNTIHGVPWETERASDRHDDGKGELDSQLKRNLDKKRQKLEKTESSVELVGYHKKDDSGATPSIPEDSEIPHETIRQSSSQTFTSKHTRIVPHSSKGTISASSSFEFRTSFSPPTSSYRLKSLSPTQELENEIQKGSHVPVGRTVSLADDRAAGRGSKVLRPASMFDEGEGLTVYRPNLEDTHLPDVTVFGKHFDPSQLTQERMEANVGDLSSVGLNPTVTPLKKKKGEEVGRGGKREEFDRVAQFSSESLRSDSWSKSASVSPKRQKGERDPILRKGRISSVKAHESGGNERDKLLSWEVELSPHASRHSAVLSTPSRYRMARVAHSMYEPIEGDINDVFADEIGKGSMPDIYHHNNPPATSVSPRHGSSTRRVKEGTPDSGTSDEEKPKKKRSIGFSLGRKLSTSMKELFAKEKKNPTTRTTWHFETSSELNPAPSDPQLSVLTEHERREILEETEVVPKTRSTKHVVKSHQALLSSSSNETSYSTGNPLGHLFVRPTGAATNVSNSGFYEERLVDGCLEMSVDLPSSKQRSKSGSSGDDYETASENEEGHAKSVVNIITTTAPSNSAVREAGYFAGGVAEGLDTSHKTGLQTGQTGLSTVMESSTASNDALNYQFPHLESAPVIKTLDGVVDKSNMKNGKSGAKMKLTSSKETSAKKDDSKKQKKPIFGRFITKDQNVVQRRSPSPGPISPSSGSISSGSRQSSGRFSPSPRATSTASSASSGTNIQPPNVNSARRTSKSSVSSSSPSGSFRGGQSSPFSPGGRGSPRGSFGGGGGSLRGSGRGSSVPLNPSGLSIQRGATSPNPGGLNSPRGSFKTGSTSPSQLSPHGSTKGRKTSPQGGPRNVKSPSPRSSERLKTSPLSNGRRSPSTQAKEPSAGILQRNPSLKPVRQAPPPPSSSSSSQNNSKTSISLSRRSSQPSTLTPSGDNSSTSSPRQRKKGVSLTHSPLTPRRILDIQLLVPGKDDGASKHVKSSPDDIGRLLTTVGQKLAPLSASPEPNPLDAQTEFEIPPPVNQMAQKSASLDEKVPTYTLSSSGELHVEGERPPIVDDVIMTPEDSPVPVRRGLRPKTVISALIGGRKKSTSASAGTKKSSSNTQKGAAVGGGSIRKEKGSVLSSAASSGVAGGRLSPSVTSGRDTSKQQSKNSISKQQQQQRVTSGLPPRAPSFRGGKPGDVGGRSQSSIVVPKIRVNETRKSVRKMSSHVPAGSSLSGGLRSSRGAAMGSQSSLVRSSIRVSSKLKKNNPMSPEHRKVSSLTRPKTDRPSSRGSMHSLPRNSVTTRASVRRPVRVAPVAPGRASTHKLSTAGTEILNKNLPTSSTPERRRHSVLSKSLRKTSTMRSPTQGLSGSESLHRNIATRSMRMSSSRKVSALGTMPRSSVVTKMTSPIAVSNLQMTPTRKSMRKVSNTKDVYDAFDQISADAKGKLLTSSDHRRMVRPKLRQKASASHLRMLQERKDITSEMLAPSDSDEEAIAALNANTNLAKKHLAPAAVAGLAMKLDLTSVKLRKTGISDQMLMDRSADISKDLPNFAVGAEYDTKHTTMLLQIKGRRQVHTRLVEPSVTSMNSGDVYICVSGKFLYHWIGKSGNVIEKARGSDVAIRIVHKKELGCQATAPVVIKEEVRESGSTKIDKFWQLLGGKRGVKSSESVPNDDLYEKSVNMVTVVMQLEGENDHAHFTTIHESSNHMLKMAVLDTKKILLLDFYSEVYVWVGKMSPPKLRKKAIELAKKHFNSGCKPPVFTHQGAGGSTVIRSSGRYRAKVSSTHNPRNSTLTRSGRRVSRTRKESTVSTKRPSWALFNRLNEGSEHILFREKFSDWPEQGRIIKMKGHSTGPVMPSGPVELVPADVEKMLRPIPKFDGLRLDGDNIHRGQGNYKVSRSTFACNRVHPDKVTKWVIKDNDNVVVPESDHGLFFAQEAYVIRWSYRITVVKELEGLTPGDGMFARDRKRRQQKDREVKDAQQTSEVARGNDSSDTESEGEGAEPDEESRRTLESGGRDKVAYFFWQGDEATVNEKGASALLTVELDKERGPQVRVVQNNEPPAFLNLFGGGMVLLNGRSETMSFKSPARPIRLFFVRGQMRNEGCLVEIDPEHWPLAKFFRSRGCYVIYDGHSDKVYLWKGCKITTTLRKVSHTAARLLKRRLKADLVMVEEGQEPKDLCSLVGDKTAYDSMLNDTRLLDFTPRLFELSSTTGEFVATELTYNARGSDIEAAPFLQSDLYTASQPAIFLLDAHRMVYVWLGWWPQERRDWSIDVVRETNITTGSADARWLRDKKLALQTAQLYAKASTETRRHQPRTYMIHAGTEPDQFIHLFPFWKPNKKVQDIRCKGRKPIPSRVDVDEELLKYSRTQFTLKELQKRPLPEGVDPSLLETYITDEEFQAVFRITREQFKKFPGWKQTEIKKRHGLF